MQRSGLDFKRTLGVGRIPVLQRDKAFTLAQGGFVLDKTGLTNGDFFREGTPVIFSEANRTLKLVRTATVQANAASNAVNIRVAKGSPLNVNDNIMSAPGGAAYPITAIDTSNPAYDTVTISTTLGVGLTAGQTLYNSSATGATAGAFPAGINGLLYDDLIVQDGIQQTVSAIIRGIVYARRTAYSAELAALPGLDDIIYSQSF